METHYIQNLSCERYASSWMLRCHFEGLCRHQKNTSTSASSTEMVRRQRRRRRQPRIQWAQALQRDKLCCLLRSPLQCHRPFIAAPGNRITAVEGSTATVRIARTGRARPEQDHWAWMGSAIVSESEGHFQSRDGTDVENLRGRKTPKRGRKQFFARPSFRNGFTPSSLRLEDKFRRLLRFERISGCITPWKSGVHDDQSPAFLLELKPSSSIPLRSRWMSRELWCLGNIEKTQGISSKQIFFASLDAPLNLLFNILVSLLKTRNSWR